MDSSGSIAVTWCRQGDNSGTSTKKCHAKTYGNRHAGFILKLSGKWEYRASQQQMYHSGRGECLALEPESSRPIMRPCDDNNAYHKWVWKEIQPYWAKNKG